MKLEVGKIYAWTDLAADAWEDPFLVIESPRGSERHTFCMTPEHKIHMRSADTLLYYLKEKLIVEVTE